MLALLLILFSLFIIQLVPKITFLLLKGKLRFIRSKHLILYNFHMLKSFITEETINLLRALLAASTAWIAYNAIASQLSNSITII